VLRVRIIVLRVRIIVLNVRIIAVGCSHNPIGVVGARALLCTRRPRAPAAHIVHISGCTLPAPAPGRYTQTHTPPQTHTCKHARTQQLQTHARARTHSHKRRTHELARSVTHSHRVACGRTGLAPSPAPRGNANSLDELYDCHCCYHHDYRHHHYTISYHRVSIDPHDAAGTYQLRLEVPYERAIACVLAHIANDDAHAVFKTAKLGGALPPSHGAQIDRSATCCADCA
jgi:hypothetical protein